MAYCVLCHTLSLLLLLLFLLLLLLFLLLLLLFLLLLLLQWLALQIHHTQNKQTQPPKQPLKAPL